MKRTIELLILVGMLGVFSAPVFAQKECTDENKAAWYDTFLKNYKGDPPQQKIAEDPGDKIADYMKNKFVIPYEKLTAGTDQKKKFQDAYSQSNWAEAVTLGKQIVQGEPDFVPGYIMIALSGYNATTKGNAALLPDAAEAATKALEFVEAGKPFAPFTSKDSAVGWLNYVIGKNKLKSAPADAIPFILKGAKLDADLKKSPGLYIDLAQAYAEGPLDKMTSAYKAQYAGKDETPESKLALENIYQMMDRQIDALARAVAYATGPDKKTYMDALTEVYQGRNKSADGLDQLVANITSKPLPDMPTPLTSLPTPTQTGTPGSNAGGSASGTPVSNTTPNTTKPAATNTGTQKPAATTGASKPTPTPSPTPNRKPRNNFRHN
jgi:hypothetical protein